MVQNQDKANYYGKMQCEVVSIFMIKKKINFLEALYLGTSSHFCQLATFVFSVSSTCHHFDKYYNNVLKLLLM